MGKLECTFCFDETTVRFLMCRAAYLKFENVLHGLAGNCVLDEELSVQRHFS